MPILNPSSSAQAQFVDFQKIPAHRAEADTTVVLSAYLEALESLLALSTEDMPDIVMSGLYESFVQLKSLRERVNHELDKADVMIAVITERLF